MGLLFSRLPTQPEPGRAALGPTPQAGSQARLANADQAVADPDDLVARALKILADESAAWQARRCENRPSGHAR